MLSERICRLVAVAEAVVACSRSSRGNSSISGSSNSSSGSISSLAVVAVVVVAAAVPLNERVISLKKRSKLHQYSASFCYVIYRKIRGLYFSKALFEGLIFGGAYLRREICVSESIGLAL